MKKLLQVLKLLARALAVLLLIATTVINLAMAYIMFMPDHFPKPFYLSYYMPTPLPTASSEATEGSPIFNPPPAQAAPEEGTAIVPHEIKPGQGVMIDTGIKIVNLAEPGGRKYVRINVVLEFAPTAPEYFSESEEERQAFIQAFQEELAARIPVINDGLITLLSSKRFEDVYTAEGKEALRQQIMDLINARLPEYKVIYAYFTEFVVQ